MQNRSSPAGGFFRRLLVTFAGACCTLCLVAMPGCGGCNKNNTTTAQQKKKEEEEKKKKKQEEKPKLDFEIRNMAMQPFDKLVPPNLVKPGHWVTAERRIKANNFDFQGELQTACVGPNERPIDIEATPYQLTVSRPVILPKGQEKNVELQYFIQRGTTEINQTSVRLACRLLGSSGREVVGGGDVIPTMPLPQHQFLFVALVRDPNSYGYLKRLPAVQWKSLDFDDTKDMVYYRVLIPEFDRQVPLPSNALTWTSYAYLLLDEVNPQKFTPDQQQAMLDWLHWGGQLIVNGPDTLDLWRGSFLEPYLPAFAGKLVELKSDAFAEINRNWSMDRVEKVIGEKLKKVKRPRNIEVNDEKPSLGVELELRPGGEFLESTGRLVCEKRIGAGRIVITSFSLSDPHLVNWGSFDGFFHGCLLRRPKRQFVTGQSLSTELTFAVPYQASTRDPRLVSTVRFFSRDVGHGSTKPAASSPADTTDWRLAGYDPQDVAAWRDNNATSTAVRELLRDASGIKIPKAEFVLNILGVYLVILVPLNWGVFRLIGRVEWAWVAAPIVAIVATVAVVRLAQLDIGFVRSSTEIGVLEVQGGYDRGHATRFVSLYSSLATRFDLHFTDDTALALPFAAKMDFKRGPLESARGVRFRRDKDTRLEGFLVDSNDTRFVHAEHMLPLGGTVDFTGNERTGWQVRNGSQFTVRGTAVLRRNSDGAYEVAWLGDLDPKTSRTLKFEEVGDELVVSQWQSMPIATQGERDGQVRLWRLLDLATKQLSLLRGEVRLVGWIDEAMPGLETRPKASQSVHRTMVVVHLRRPDLPAPQRDLNLPPEDSSDDDDEDKFEPPKNR